MCISEYDLVCDDCRRKHDEIFTVEAKDLIDEEKKYQQWIQSLCEDCQNELQEEGFVPPTEKTLVVKMKGPIKAINSFCSEIGEISNKYDVDLENTIPSAHSRGSANPPGSTPKL